MAPLKAMLESLGEEQLRSAARQESELLKFRAQFKNRLDALSRQMDEIRLESSRQHADIVLLLKKLEAKETRQFGAIDRMVSDIVSRAQSGAVPLPSSPAGLPLVTVVMPVWNRETTVLRAIKKLLNQSETRWECLVVDDGSEDASVAIVQNVAKDDSRIRVIQQTHRGAAVARNAALAVAKGEVIAYCDSDNVFHPDYLAHVVSAFAADPKLMCAYTAQTVLGSSDEPPLLRYEWFAWETLRKHSFIDLNVFSHRREVFERFGGFDEDLGRVQDWDLILRYTRHLKTASLPVIGGEYHQDAPHRISEIESGNYHVFLVQEKLRRAEETSTRTGPRVLHVLPGDSERPCAGARHEIEAAAAAGFDTRIWPEQPATALWQTDIPACPGLFHEAAAAFAPDVIHIQGLATAHRVLPMLGEQGCSVTVRAHETEGLSEVREDILNHPRVRCVWLHSHPHEAPWAHGKMAVLTPGIHSNGFRPSREKDWRLVLLSGVTLTSEDCRTFMETAAMCPDHQFVLILRGESPDSAFLEGLNAMNRSLGAPVSIAANLSSRETAEWLSKAAIFMQASLAATDCGHPTIEILETMACGCVPLLPRSAVLESSYGGAMPLWHENSQSAAAQILSTTSWSVADWRRRGSLALDFVYPRHLCSETLATMFAVWRAA